MNLYDEAIKITIDDMRIAYSSSIVGIEDNRMEGAIDGDETIETQLEVIGIGEVMEAN
jgi:hypothetical protein